MEKYYYKKVLIGIKITKFPEGSIPQTNPKESVGILTFKHPKGSHFKAHTHKPLKRTTDHLEECFIVRKGRLKIKLFGPDKRYFKTLYLKSGEALLTIHGGHEVTVLDDCEMFEIKNGPYEVDKVFI